MKGEKEANHVHYVYILQSQETINEILSIVVCIEKVREKERQIILSPSFFVARKQLNLIIHENISLYLIGNIIIAIYLHH